MSEPVSPIEAAIELLGGPTKGAEVLDVSPAVIGMWKLRNRIPADKVLAVETATGISRHVLRPDIFGPAKRTKATPAENAA